MKGVFLDGNFILNTDYFYSDIDNYQQGVRVVDEYTTALNAAAGLTEIAYTTATGNVPKVRAKGLEIDGVYAGIPNTQLRFAARLHRRLLRGVPELRAAERERLRRRAGVPRRFRPGVARLAASWSGSHRRRLPAARVRRPGAPRERQRRLLRARATPTTRCRSTAGFRAPRSWTSSVGLGRPHAAST